MVIRKAVLLTILTAIPLSVFAAPKTALEKRPSLVCRSNVGWYGDMIAASVKRKIAARFPNGEKIKVTVEFERTEDAQAIRLDKVLGEQHFDPAIIMTDASILFGGSPLPGSENFSISDVDSSFFPEKLVECSVKADLTIKSSLKVGKKKIKMNDFKKKGIILPGSFTSPKTFVSKQVKKSKFE